MELATTGEEERDLRVSTDNARSRVLGLGEVGLDRDGEWLRLVGTDPPLGLCDSGDFGVPLLDEDIEARAEEVGWVANQIGFKELETGIPISA